MKVISKPAPSLPQAEADPDWQQNLYNYEMDDRPFRAPLELPAYLEPDLGNDVDKGQIVETAIVLKNKIFELESMPKPRSKADNIKYNKAIEDMHRLYRDAVDNLDLFKEIFESDTNAAGECGYLLHLSTEDMLEADNTFSHNIIKILHNKYDGNLNDATKQVFLMMHLEPMKIIEWACNQNIEPEVFKIILSHPSSSKLFKQSYFMKIGSQEFKFNLLELMLHKEYNVDYIQILKGHCVENALLGIELESNISKMLSVNLNHFRAYLVDQPESVKMHKEGRDILSYLFEHLSRPAIGQEGKELLEQKIKIVLQSYSYKTSESHDLIVLNNDHITAVIDFVQAHKDLFPLGFQSKCAASISSEQSQRLIDQLMEYNAIFNELLAKAYQSRLAEEERSIKDEP